MAISAVLVALCYIPLVAIFVALYSPLLHLVWVFALAHTVLIYGLALTPAMIEWKESGWRKRGVMAGAPVLALAILPAVFGHAMFADYKNKITAADFVSPPKIDPQSIGIVTYDASRCDEACENALYDNQIQSVIIVGARKPYAATKFWLEQRDRCPEVRHAGKDRRSNLTSGRCLISAAANIDDADVLLKTADISDTERRRRDTPLWRRLRKNEQDRLLKSRHSRTGIFAVWQTEFNRQIEIYERVEGVQVIAAIQTMIRSQIANFPFFIGTQHHEGSWVPVWLAFGAERTINDSDIRTVLANRYGRKPAHGDAPPKDELAEYRRIMARTYAETDSLTQQELETVRPVLKKRFGDNRHKLTTEDIELVRLAIRQPAYRQNGIGHMANYHAQAIAALAPDIVARLEAVPREHDAFRMDVADMFLALPPETLRAYGPRMLAVIKDPKRSVYLNKMIARMDLVAEDATPVLLRLYKDGRTRRAAVMGLCRVASPANQAGVKIFERALADPETQRRDYLFLMGGLVRSGARDRLDAIIAQASPDQRNAMQLMLRHVGAEFKPDRCYFV